MTTLQDAPLSARHGIAQTTLELLPGERWWGGAADDARHMPYGASEYRRDLRYALEDPANDSEEGRPSNQSAPFLASSKGRVVGSDSPFSFAFSKGTLVVEGADVVTFEAPGGSLRDAFLAGSARFFPPSGEHPALELFTAPQYNTWIEQPYKPTQDSVLAYAKGLLDAGMRPGVLIIDDSWSPDYGTWTFDAARFPAPEQMMTQLHEWGFRVMLWLVPFVSPDSAAFRDLEAQNLLVRDRRGRTAIRRWWNGLSAILDVSNDDAVAWLTGHLDALVEKTGVDGFKFDGGDIRDFRDDDVNAGSLSPTSMCEAWARFGLKYPFNEFRACWRMGGQPLAQRLQDKPPRWDGDGIGSLIPEMVAQGLIGHPFVCPDMIGGGEIVAMSGQAAIDQEFFVRFAQVAALSPMAQFSVAPARVLDDEHRRAVEDALRIRDELMPVLEELIAHAARTGEPVVRAMAYHAPELSDVTDQFFFGPDLLVAPVLQPGQSIRAVQLPSGRWRSQAGEEHEGPATVGMSCSISTIPRFYRVA